MEEKEIKKILWISGLKNALEFGGVPNKKAMMGKLMAERKDLRPHAKEIIPILDEIIEEIKNLNPEEQKRKLLELDPKALDKKEGKAEEKLLPPLPEIEKYKKIVMRLAPYPSGALHIGNARMIVLNDEYVKKYNGELILFYDDTIGSPMVLRESPRAKYVLPEAYDLIKEGLEWLGVKYSKILYKSDRLDIFYEYCAKLIKDHIAYVCFCSAVDFREKYKEQGMSCPHREHTIEKNLNEWNAMLNKAYHEGEAVVRLKTGMDQKDPALRDQIIMRISEAKHPRVGEKYIIWPMLEFSWAIDDYLIGASHIIRGIDLVKEGIIEEFVWDHFGWKKAKLLYYGRLRFPGLKLSKTEARNKIQSGEYTGWEDPRTWSMQSLKKRGIRAAALRESLLDLGMSQTGINFSVNWLYSKNQNIIDKISDRYFYVEDPITVVVDNVPSDEYIAEPLLHPSNPKRGKRKIRCVAKNHQLTLVISFSDAEKLKTNQILRFKDLVNIKINSVDLNKKLIQSSFHSKELDRQFSIIHWLPKDENIKVILVNPDGTTSNGLGELNLLQIPMDQTIQFERFGFVNPIELKENCLFCYFSH
ncbi:MAG: glutamate--tRNA ligase [Candidatus Lokiarchaeota archaeon]|nr:glutamate--tRNA ligase [Candidatus Lokiarchaeota archaeon]